MLQKSVLCPVCKIPLQEGSSVCPDCKQDLSALVYLERQSEILYNEGLRLIQAGEDEQAVESLIKALDLDKSNLLAAIVLGKIYAQRKEYSAAEAVWTQAQQLYPKSTELHDQLAALETEVQAAHDKEVRSLLEAEQKERGVNRRKSLWRAAQLGLAFILGSTALAAIPMISRSIRPDQLDGTLTQIDIATLQAFQTAVVITTNPSQNTLPPSITPINPTKTPSPVITSTPILPTATAIQPSRTPLVPDLLPLVNQAVGRDPSLATLALSFVQSGSRIYVTGKSPDIRTRYLVEVTVREVSGVEGVDMSGVVVTTGDISSAPDQCVISTGVEGGQVNLRDGPGTRFKSIDLLEEGAIVNIIQPGDWFQVTTGGGITGWVSSLFCDTN